MSDTSSNDLGDLFQQDNVEEKTPPTPSSIALHTRSRPNVQPREIKINLVGSHPLWGHYLWNAARYFADFLDTHASTYCRGRRVLELGAAGALPSIVAVLNGAEQVVITDYPDPELIQHIRMNVEENVPREGGMRGRVHIEGHIWGRDVRPLLNFLGSSEKIEEEEKDEGGPKFDVILLSDLVFNHSQHEALLKSCEACLAPSPPSLSSSAHTPNPQPCVLVFYTHHRPHLAQQDLEFFALAKKRGWDTERIVQHRMEAMFKDDPGDEDVRATVWGWRMWRA